MCACPGLTACGVGGAVCGEGDASVGDDADPIRGAAAGDDRERQDDAAARARAGDDGAAGGRGVRGPRDAAGADLHAEPEEHLDGRAVRELLAGDQRVDGRAGVDDRADGEQRRGGGPQVDR
eukprot:3504821-Rhodomonas_salina.2